jgi:hypothetical protein
LQLLLRIAQQHLKLDDFKVRVSFCGPQYVQFVAVLSDLEFKAFQAYPIVGVNEASLSLRVVPLDKQRN